MSLAPSTQDAAIEPCAADRVQTLLELTESLSQIFEQENLALAQSRADDITSLQQEKARLAAAYAQSIQLVAADRTSITEVDPVLLARLRVATEEFNARAARQKGLLDRAGGQAAKLAEAI